MENITTYCDEIYELLCSLDKNTSIQNSDSHIWNDRERSLDEYSNITFSYQTDREDDRPTLEEAQKDDEIGDELLSFLQEEHDLGFPGRQCERIKEKCFDSVMSRFLSLGLKDKKIYVKDILNKMSYIRLNHPLAERAAFDRVAPELFQKLIEKFQDYGINIHNILSTFGPYERRALCSLLKITYEEQSHEKSSNQVESQDLKVFFNPAYQAAVLQFIERLEIEGLIKDNVYIHPRKNHLAKLLRYMQDEGVIQKRYKKTTLWRHFYGYFGINVVETVKESTNENVVTRSNLNKGLNNDLSEEETKDFDLICSVFIPKRE